MSDVPLFLSTVKLMSERILQKLMNSSGLLEADE